MSKKSFRDWIEMKNGMLLWALTLYRQLAVDATEPIGSRASRQIQDDWPDAYRRSALA